MGKKSRTKRERREHAKQLSKKMRTRVMAEGVAEEHADEIAEQFEMSCETRDNIINILFEAGDKGLTTKSAVIVLVELALTMVYGEDTKTLEEKGEFIFNILFDRLTQTGYFEVPVNGDPDDAVEQVKKALGNLNTPKETIH